MKDGIRPTLPKGFQQACPLCFWEQFECVSPSRRDGPTAECACRHREKMKCREIFALVTENPYTRKEKQSCL
jgi:hypothetical protein